MSCSHAIKVLLHQVTEKAVQVGHSMHHMKLRSLYHEVIVSQEKLFSLKDYTKQRNSNQKIFVARNTIQQVLACAKIGSNKAMKTTSVVTEGNEKEITVLWIAKFLLLIFLRRLTDCSGRKHVLFSVRTACDN